MSIFAVLQGQQAMRDSQMAEVSDAFEIKQMDNAAQLGDLSVVRGEQEVASGKRRAAYETLLQQFQIGKFQQEHLQGEMALSGMAYDLEAQKVNNEHLQWMNGPEMRDVTRGNLLAQSEMAKSTMMLQQLGQQAQVQTMLNKQEAQAGFQSKLLEIKGLSQELQGLSEGFQLDEEATLGNMRDTYRKEFDEFIQKDKKAMELTKASFLLETDPEAFEKSVAGKLGKPLTEELQQELKEAYGKEIRGSFNKSIGFEGLSEDEVISSQLAQQKPFIEQEIKRDATRAAAAKISKIKDQLSVTAQSQSPAIKQQAEALMEDIKVNYPEAYYTSEVEETNQAIEQLPYSFSRALIEQNSGLIQKIQKGEGSLSDIAAVKAKVASFRQLELTKPNSFLGQDAKGKALSEAQTKQLYSARAAQRLQNWAATVDGDDVFEYDSFFVEKAKFHTGGYNPKQAKYRRMLGEVVDEVLRRKTGAAVSKKEFENIESEIFGGVRNEGQRRQALNEWLENVIGDAEAAGVSLSDSRNQQSQQTLKTKAKLPINQ